MLRPSDNSLRPPKSRVTSQLRKLHLNRAGSHAACHRFWCSFASCGGESGEGETGPENVSGELNQVMKGGRARRQCVQYLRKKDCTMGQHRPRVLIVEDDTVFRRGLAHLFQANETEVIQASDGKRAQALIGDQRFDLVICDYWLPGVDGLSG